MGAQVLGQVDLGRLGRQVPGGLDRSQRASRAERVRCGDPDERALLDDRHARHRDGPRDVDRSECRADGRRSKHPPMEHPRTGQVGWIAPGSRHDGRPGDPGRRASDQLLGGSRRQRRAGRGNRNPAHPAYQVPVGGQASRLPVADGTVGRDELAGRDVPARGGEAEQVLACRRRGPAKLLAGIRHRAAPERAPVPRAQVRVAHHQADRREGHPQLLGDSQRERGAVVLPDIDLPGEGGDHAVGADVQPGIRARRPVGRVRRLPGLQDDHEALREHVEVVPLRGAGQVPGSPRPS